MKRWLVLLFGAVSYAVFFGTFVYQVGFVTGLAVPKTVDSGAAAPLVETLVVNSLLLGAFALQHTIMARLAFKRWWTRFIPEPAERSFFVLASSLLLLAMNWLWKPLPEVVWSVESDAARAVLHGVSILGWVLVLYSTFLISHFDLFGLRQVWLQFREREYTKLPFKDSVLYRWVRHPIMLGFIVAFWGGPDMSQGRLLFAVATTIYILVGIHFEERTLIALHGEDYQRYRKRVSMIIPMPPKTT